MAGLTMPKVITSVMLLLWVGHGFSSVHTPLRTVERARSTTTWERPALAPKYAVVAPFSAWWQSDSCNRYGARGSRLMKKVPLAAVVTALLATFGPTAVTH